MSLDDSPVSAAVLASALQVAPLDPADVLDRLYVPAIRRVVRRTPAPLDLDSAIFRYRVDADDHIRVLPGVGRLCRHRHR